jgi:hypothetical protein
MDPVAHVAMTCPLCGGQTSSTPSARAKHERTKQHQNAAIGARMAAGKDPKPQDEPRKRKSSPIRGETPGEAITNAVFAADAPEPEQPPIESPRIADRTDLFGGGPGNYAELRAERQAAEAALAEARKDFAKFKGYVNYGRNPKNKAEHLIPKYEGQRDDAEARVVEATARIAELSGSIDAELASKSDERRAYWKHVVDASLLMARSDMFVYHTELTGSSFRVTLETSTGLAVEVHGPDPALGADLSWRPAGVKWSSYGPQPQTPHDAAVDLANTVNHLTGLVEM